MRNWQTTLVLSAIAVALGYVSDAHAQDASKAGLKTCKHPRFFAHEPNSFVAQNPRGDDEVAIRVHYSFRFLMNPSRDQEDAESGPGKPCVLPEVDPVEWYFKYTGEFDFYAGTRPSGPVINRISNPGLHRRMNFSKGNSSVLRWADIGLEHLSNGQTTEVTKGFDVTAQTAYAANDYKYFDTISRGTNFLSAEVMLSDHPNQPDTEFHIKLKLDFKNDTHVSWGPLADTGTSIKDYDRVQLTLIQNVGPGQLSVKWTFGDKLLSTDSWDLDILPCLKCSIPLFVRYHTGPLQTLSNYTQPVQSLGIGLKLSY